MKEINDISAQTLPESVGSAAVAEELAKEVKRRKIKLIKAVSAFVVFAVVCFFITIAWFTQSREIGSDGMQMDTEGSLFTIQPVGSPYVAGIYDDSAKTRTYVRNTLLSGASKEQSVLTWTITNDTVVTDSVTNKTSVTKGKNIGNGPADGYQGGISPGSSGELQFKFTPNRPVDAKLTFWFYPYSVSFDELGDEDKSTIALIGDDATGDSLIAKNLLNGHILLFKNYDSVTGKYSGLILSDDFQRIMTATYTQDTTVRVYWVWAETLAELVLDDTNNAHKRNLRGKKSICADRSDIIKLMKNNPTWFFFDPETPNRVWSEFTPTTADASVVTAINNNYSLYSAFYNEADQCIGTNVAYLLLDMAAEGTATSD